MLTRTLRPLSLLLLATTACVPAPDDDPAQPFGTGNGNNDTDDEDDTDDTDGGDSSGDGGSLPPPPPDDPPPDDPPPDDPMTCGDVGEPCQYSDECCDFASGGAVCANDEVNTLCYATCTYPAECGTECCLPLEGGTNICAPPVYCPEGAPWSCDQPGDACEANGYCCGFAAGNALCVIFPDGNHCAGTCTVGSDCVSGCCVGLDNGAGACAPSEYCGSQGGDVGRPDYEASTPASVPSHPDHAHAIR